jgi:hypothetical protein
MPDPSLRRDADKPAGRPIPLVSFPLDYNDLRGMGLLAGLILGRHDMALLRSISETTDKAMPLSAVFNSFISQLVVLT